jgi:CRISPR type III-B/RAMP module RAMP protein Cmr1
MELDLTFVTPLWTADATGEAHHAEGTGIMGSLRWWCEALIRGLDGWACDPSGEGAQCGLDGDAFKKRHRQGCAHAGKGRLCGECEAEALKECGLCAACQVFGATGWARTFSIAIKADTKRAYPPTGEGRVVRRDPETGHRSSFFFPRGLTGNLAVALLPRRPDDLERVRLLIGLLEFIRRNAALGAKTNLGYGLFKWEKLPQGLPSPTTFSDRVASLSSRGPKGPHGIAPDLRKMFFAEVKLGKAWQPMDFADLKCALRADFREGGAIQRIVPDEDARRLLRHFILGTTEDKPTQASKIKLALLPDRRTLRVWGWIAEELPDYVAEQMGVSSSSAQEQQTLKLTNKVWQDRTRGQVMSLVFDRINRCGTFSRWREFDSDRDTVRRYTDPQKYLQSLMEDRT